MIHGVANIDTLILFGITTKPHQSPSTATMECITINTLNTTTTPVTPTLVQSLLIMTIGISPPTPHFILQ